MTFSNFKYCSGLGYCALLLCTFFVLNLSAQRRRFGEDPSWKYQNKPAPEMMEVKIKNKTLRAFGVNYKKGKIYIHWSVALEKSKGWYQIERSFDKRKWDYVGTKSGIGTNLPVLLSYYLTDEINEAGTYYYRLRKYHEDKSYYESDVMEVFITEKQAQKMERHMEFSPDRAKRTKKRKRFIFF